MEKIGIITQSQKAKKENAQMTELEKLKLSIYAAQIDGLGTITTDNLKSEMKKSFDVDDRDVSGDGP